MKSTAKIQKTAPPPPESKHDATDRDAATFTAVPGHAGIYSLSDAARADFAACENFYDAVKALAPNAPEPLLRDAFANAKKLSEEYGGHHALMRLAQYLSKPLLRAALAVTRQMNDDRDKAASLDHLAAYLPKMLLPEAFAVAMEIGDESCRDAALNDLARVVPMKRVRDAVAGAVLGGAPIAENNSTVENSGISADNPPDKPPIRREKDVGHVQGPLHDYFESRDVPQPIRPELAAAFDALVMARKEVAGRAPNAPIKPPLPELTPKQIQAVIRRGGKRPWSGRAFTRMNTFEWVRDNYKEWAGKGLLQAHIKTADPDLYVTFSKQIERKGLPDWLDVPSEDEAKLRKVTDPQKREALLTARVFSKVRNKLATAAYG